MCRGAIVPCIWLAHDQRVSNDLISNRIDYGGLDLELITFSIHLLVSLLCSTLDRQARAAVNMCRQHQKAPVTKWRTIHVLFGITREVLQTW